jgi:hypothetical protein
MKLDAKFYGEIRKAKDDSLVPADEYVVFLAKDDAFAAILPHYRTMCHAMGATAEQLQAIDRMIERLEFWRSNTRSDARRLTSASPKSFSGDPCARNSLHGSTPR